MNGIDIIFETSSLHLKEQRKEKAISESEYSNNFCDEEPLQMPFTYEHQCHWVAVCYYANLYND